MRAYIIRRLLLLIPVAIGVVTLTFAFLRMVRGSGDDHAREQARQTDVSRSESSSASKDRFRVNMLIYHGPVRGNMGTSFPSGSR